jgi:folate-binding protein YgfZ
MGVTSPFAEQERKAGALHGERFGTEVPAHYGDSIGEYQAVRGGVGLLDLSFRGLLELQGGERLRWLNGQITNDVKGLLDGAGLLAAALTAKGHILSDLAVYGLGASVWIDLNRDRVETVRSAFDRHIIADDVIVGDASDRCARLMVVGPEAPDLLASAVGPEVADLKAWHHTEARIAGVAVRVIASRWLKVPGFEVVAPTDAADRIWGALFEMGRGAGLRPVGMAALDVLRVEAGWPWFGVDLDEQNLLMESLTSEHVSFSKGCYVGQELVIRVEHQGHLNKRLGGLLISGKTLPSCGATIFLGDRKAGHVTSAVHSPTLERVIALAYLRRECWEPGTLVRISSGPGAVEAVVATLPFVAG